ncbi:uncharacterized protein PHALS_02542 [Plasmopara halstedii]|uniref:Uncharacterized protein n=1 Tax=Plasmopara halstedii TaxID=4781 RepID=A0A0P1AYZ7_PLAHL|nr:uncharacterized protein PHALS_02542 [Plasmopara halstedii]CEG46120.1 hypothetical protein PHALS_02542 [Plasmopara halstedii]|eukprot:XP_024582489.1 hypothetical protein PHALS_02542 [Plasmopara halstedii]
MASVSLSTRKVNTGLPNTSINKCRYKTGKCNHMRSSKRNGQLHQLCLFHRNKANMIQRRFDRQKRRAARAKFVRDRHNPASPTSVSMLASANPAESPTGSTSSMSSYIAYSSCNSSDVNISSDSKKIWVELTHVGSASASKYFDMPLPSSCHQSYMSCDEIAFLCAAILE